MVVLVRGGGRRRGDGVGGRGHLPVDATRLRGGRGGRGGRDGRRRGGAMRGMDALTLATVRETVHERQEGRGVALQDVQGDVVVLARVQRRPLEVDAHGLQQRVSLGAKPSLELGRESHLERVARSRRRRAPLERARPSARRATSTQTQKVSSSVMTWL